MCLTDHWRIVYGSSIPKTQTLSSSYQKHTPLLAFSTIAVLEMLEFPKAPLRRSTMCDDLGVINKRVHTAFTRVKLHETPRARMQQPLSDTRPTGTESPILSTYTRDQRPDPRHRRRSPHHQRPETRDQRPDTSPAPLTSRAHARRRARALMRLRRTCGSCRRAPCPACCTGGRYIRST